MQKKDIKFGKEARKLIVDGINIVCKVASETMGEQGNYTIIEQLYGSPKVTKDGYYSIKDIEFEDPFMNQGALLIKEAAKKSAEEAGDGTTTCCVLAREIINRAINVVEAGSSQTYVKKGIEIAVKIICEELNNMSIKVDKDSEMIEQVATISANNNSEIGKQIADAMKEITSNGVITVDESKSLDSRVEVVEGMKIDRGYISPFFINNSDKLECVLENPYILLHDEQISGIKPILKILEDATKEGRGVLIIAKDVNNEALATLIQNKVKGNLPLACIHAPGYGASMIDELEDVALITGGTVISETTGHNLETSSLEMLGEADKVIITRNSTTFIGGKGDKELIESRVSAIRNQIKSITEPYVKEMLNKRLANIDGGIAVFYVGGATETEVDEKKDLIEDAIAATKSAIEMGVVPGGGSSLVHASKSLLNIDYKEYNKDVAIGIEIIRESLFAPLKQIMLNAGEPSDMILEKVKESEFNYAGYNLKSGMISNMVVEGILDTAKVEISALTNASSVASMVLMGSSIITNIPSNDNK
ncbi:MAG: Hsp60 family chaperonin [Promethearchaeota archaeon]|jgi:chaperonin GroEL